MSLAQHIDEIEAIDDEVNVLHSLLLEILPKLDGVSAAEYTHGPDEMGADFVLERRDEATSSLYHVGVVAKKDKILLNADDVDRQIDQCFTVRRHFRNGTDEIRLQEVWVITSKNVSERAKKRFHDKYPGRKISFLDSKWVAETVDKHYPIYWHQLPTATGAYLAGLIRTIGDLDAQTNLLLGAPTSTAYIDLDVETVESNQYTKKGTSRRAKIVNFQDEVIKNRISLLEAEMGFGKSKLVRRLVTTLANPESIKQTKILPVFQTFASLSASNFESLEKNLETRIGKSVLDEVRAGGLEILLVLDGIDEACADGEKCKAIVTKICNEVAGTNVHVLLTSRPFKLLEEVPAFANSGVRYRIRPLSTTKMLSYINEVCKQFNAPEKLLQDLGKSDLFKQLPQNPIAATLLSNLISQTTQDLPSNLTELYAKTMEFMLGRWDEKRALSTEKEYKAGERVARLLARYMVDNELVFMSKDEAEGMVKTYLNDRNIGVSDVEVSKYIFHRSGIFGEFEDTRTLFFRHRSFAEYLYARDAYEQRDLEINQDAFHPYWINVYFFYLGSLSDCQTQLKQLITLEPADVRARWIKAFQLGTYLLAGYQSPYSTVENGLPSVIAEFAKLYLDVRDGKLKSTLDKLPEMALFCIFTTVMKNQFGYSFFKKALPSAMLELEDSTILSDEVRKYALFFAASALGELDDGCGYDFLLKQYATDKLPLPISFAVDCETRLSVTGLDKRPLVKAHLKRLHKLLAPPSKDPNSKSRAGGKAMVSSLFEKPLNSLRSKEEGAVTNPQI